jgi:hypothetical protein
VQIDKDSMMMKPLQTRQKKADPVSVRFSEHIDRAIRDRAAAIGESPSVVIRELIRRGLGQDGTTSDSDKPSRP